MYVLLIVVCPFVLFHLAIVLSVLLRYTDSDCPFGIFKLFSLRISYSDKFPNNVSKSTPGMRVHGTELALRTRAPIKNQQEG